MIIQIETEEDKEILANVEEAYRNHEISLDDYIDIRKQVLKGELREVEDDCG